MRGMALDHDRTSRRKRGCRVAARHRERQREVRCAKHGDGADGQLHEPQIGARCWRAIGLRRIVPQIQIGALFDVTGEQPELLDSASALAFQPCSGQAGFLRANRRDGVAARVDFLGNAPQKTGAVGA